jgi:hypothetical protein
MFAWGEHSVGNRVQVVLATALALSSLACATQRATLDQLAMRASFDHVCHPWELEIYAIDERTRAVVGCGRRTAYVEDCVRGRCTWIVDASSFTPPEPAGVDRWAPPASSAQSSATPGWPPPIEPFSPDEPRDVRLYTRD